MSEPWEQLESRMRAMRLEPVAAELERRILDRLAAVPGPERKRRLRRYLRWAAVAAACCLAVGVSLWILGRGGEVARPAGQITAGWRIVPTGPAVFQIASPGLVRLQRGELFVESVPWGDAAHARPGSASRRPAAWAASPQGTDSTNNSPR